MSRATAERTGAEREILENFVARIRHIVEGAATIEPRSTGYDVTPTNPNALAMFIGVDVWLQVRAGQFGGRWELALNDDRDARFAQDIVSAVIDGRAQERFGRNRSMVTITREDGTSFAEIGYRGILSSLVPDPRWQTEGRLVEYEPYL